MSATAFQSEDDNGSTLPWLEHRVSEFLSANSPDEASNWEASAIAVSESGLVSKPCKRCQPKPCGKPFRRRGARVQCNAEHRCSACRREPGLGFLELDEKRAGKWDRRIAEEESPRKRAELRMERFNETKCQACGGNGMITTERSRAASHCDDCDGLGSIRGRSCKRCLGRGQVFLGPVDYRGVTCRCGRCRGSGEVRDEDLQDVCQLCRGATYTIPCTAFEKGSSKKGKLPPGYEGGSHVETVVTAGAAGAGGSVAWADEQEIANLGADSKLLEEVRRRDPLAATVLETYLGAEGARWSRHLWGQGFSIWQHTESGRRLIVEAVEGRDIDRYVATGQHDRRLASQRASGYLARPSDIIARERAADMKSKVPNFRIRALLGKTDREARELLARSRAVLLEVAAAA